MAHSPDSPYHILGEALASLSIPHELDHALANFCDILLTRNVHVPHESRIQILKGLTPILDSEKRGSRVFRAMLLSAHLLSHSSASSSVRAEYEPFWACTVHAAQQFKQHKSAGISDDERFMAYLTLAGYLYRHHSEASASLMGEFDRLASFPDPCARINVLARSLRHSLQIQQQPSTLFAQSTRAALLVLMVLSAVVAVFNAATTTGFEGFAPVAVTLGLSLLLGFDVAVSNTIQNDKHAALLFSPALHFTPSVLTRVDEEEKAALSGSASSSSAAAASTAKPASSLAVPAPSTAAAAKTSSSAKASASTTISSSSAVVKAPTSSSNVATAATATASASAKQAPVAVHVISPAATAVVAPAAVVSTASSKPAEKSSTSSDSSKKDQAKPQQQRPTPASVSAPAAVASTASAKTETKATKTAEESAKPEKKQPNPGNANPAASVTSAASSSGFSKSSTSSNSSSAAPVSVVSASTPPAVQVPSTPSPQEEEFITVVTKKTKPASSASSPSASKKQKKKNEKAQEAAVAASSSPPAPAASYAPSKPVVVEAPKVSINSVQPPQVSDPEFEKKQAEFLKFMQQRANELLAAAKASTPLTVAPVAAQPAKSDSKSKKSKSSSSSSASSPSSRSWSTPAASVSNDEAAAADFPSLKKA